MNIVTLNKILIKTMLLITLFSDNIDLLLNKPSNVFVFSEVYVGK